MLVRLNISGKVIEGETKVVFDVCQGSSTFQLSQQVNHASYIRRFKSLKGSCQSERVANSFLKERILREKRYVWHVPTVSKVYLSSQSTDMAKADMWLRENQGEKSNSKDETVHQRQVLPDLYRLLNETLKYEMWLRSS